MKTYQSKIRFQVTVWLLALCSASCDFLTEIPEDFLSPANFYATAADAKAATIGVYSRLGYRSGDFLQISDVTSDLLTPGEPARQAGLELDTYTFDPTQEDLATLWQSVYRAINEANTVIARVPQIEMDESEKTRLVGEARFLRSLFYFDLVRIFGGVPLVLDETTDLSSLNVSRSTEDEIFNQLVDDLNFAVEALPAQISSGEMGRAAKGAALTLLAKVYLYRNQYDLVVQKCREVMTLPYGLMPINQLWDPAYENGPEHIFSIQYVAGIRGSGFNATFGVRGAEAPYTGFSSVFVEEKFVNSFEPIDKRKDVSILESYVNGNGVVVQIKPHVFKYFNPNGPTPSDTDTNWPIFRYADILLMLAEALNELDGSPSNDAYEAVNEVRQRSGLLPLSAGLSHEAFREAVLQERAWEFCFESERWFDLKRTGKLIDGMSALGKNIQQKHLLFPIPQREMDINPELAQNPGY